LGEALRSGGAGHAIVHVRHRAGELEVEVLDDGRNTERRLLGMRERVRVYGGQLDIAPRREGGHRVRARLPVGATG
jgi:signal transduction histidine kinase